MVPIEACYFLLGRPWQFDRKVMHDGFTNKLTFVHKDHKTTLVPLAPREVSEDQLKMTKKRKVEKRKRERKEKRKRQKRWVFRDCCALFLNLT